MFKDTSNAFQLDVFVSNPKETTNDQKQQQFGQEQRNSTMSSRVKTAAFKMAK